MRLASHFSFERDLHGGAALVHSFEQITLRVGCQKVALVQRSRCPCLSLLCDRFLLRSPTTEEANLPSRLKSSAKKKWGVPQYEATYNFYARVCVFFFICVRHGGKGLLSVLGMFCEAFTVT